MPKTIITGEDIEEIARQGGMALPTGKDIVFTDLAYEKAVRLGVNLNSPDAQNAPSSPVRPYLTPKFPARAKEEAPIPTVPTRSGEHPGHLRFLPGYSEVELREAIIETGKIAYQSGLMISNDGNISVRMPDQHILITPSGVCKGRIAPEDLLVIDIHGNLIQAAADPSLKASSEQPMHLEVYRQRPDVRAIIHTHLIFANALVISKNKIRMDVIPEAAAAFGSVPVTEYALPSSIQNAEVIRGLIGYHDVILIRNHGCLAVGKDLDSALIHVERLEHIAKTLTFAELLGTVNALPPELIQGLIPTPRSR